MNMNNMNMNNMNMNINNMNMNNSNINNSNMNMNNNMGFTTNFQQNQRNGSRSPSNSSQSAGRSAQKTFQQFMGNNSPHSTGSSPHPGQTSSIFTAQQSQILKFQIAAFKRFIQNQPIVSEVANVINFAYQQLQRQQLMVKQQLQQKIQQMEITKMQQQQKPKQKNAKKGGKKSGKQPRKPKRKNPPKKKKLSKKAQAAAAAAAQAAQAAITATKQIQPQVQQVPQVPQGPQVPQVSQVSQVPQVPQVPHVAQGPQVAQAAQSQQVQAVPAANHSTQQAQVPVGLPPHPPVSLRMLMEHFPGLKEVIATQNPLEYVDSYTIPEIATDIPFEYLNDPKSRVITPSILPRPIDVGAARETEKLANALEFDAELEEIRKKKAEASSKGDQEKAEELQLQCDMLELLPMQEAARGYVLSCIFHQNLLLTNHLPNFSAKTRSINMTDASIVFALDEEQKKMEQQSKWNRVVERRNNLLNATAGYKTVLTGRRQRYRKLGRQIGYMHAQTEKEEQKRTERNARKRLQALKANDEEAYVKLLDQTKDTRITHILKQTNSFLQSLTEAVKTQQRDTEDKMVSSGHVEADKAEKEIKDAEVDSENKDYYEVAHRVKETVLKQPDMLVGGELKEYQVKGLEWMVSLFNNHLNGILADEMGLGKTIQTIALLTYIYEKKHIKGPFLIIVPLSTLSNWNLEFEKWAPGLNMISYKGPPPVRKELAKRVKARDFNVLLTTYEYVIRDKHILSKIKWVHMIIDEGHRMKNTKSKLSYTLTEHYHSDYRLILTGTPLQNNLPELWALLNFVLPKIFNSVKSFDEWFNSPFANAGSQDKIELSEEETLLVIRRLHKVLRPFILRRLKKDVEKDLPDKVEKVIKCKKSGLQARMYYQMLKYNKLYVGDESSKRPVGIKGMNNKLMQLRKICNHPFVFSAIEDMVNPKGYTNDLIWRVSGKFELLDRILPKFKESGHRVLIFFQMTQIMDIMEDYMRMRGMMYLRLDGDTKADDRTGLLRMFNAPDSPYFFFLLSTRAGGLGLNLQSADTVIIFDTDWNPHQDLQAQDRAHRIGQKHEVRILRLITSDSIEEYILEKAQEKLDIDGKVIQAGKFDQKSTSEEQEALLRQLMESEESKDVEADNLTDRELNTLLARNDGEMDLFMKMDEDREKEWGDKPRLFTEEELPEVYNKEPTPENELQDVLDYGKVRRVRKVHYDETMSEDQWLKSIDGYYTDEDEDETRPKKKKKRGRKRKSKTPKLKEEDEDEAGNGNENHQGSKNENGQEKKEDENEDDDDDEDGNEEGGDAKRQKTNRAGKKSRSASAAPSSSSAKNEPADDMTLPEDAPTIKRRGRRRRYKVLPPVCRRPMDQSPLTTYEERAELQKEITQVYNKLIKYVSEDGRQLSTIFFVKPAKRFYPDYYVIIKHPLAFEDIRKKIRAEIYWTLDEFIYDVHTMFKNARIYNQESSLIYHDAQFLEDLALQDFKDRTGKTIDFSSFDSEFGLTKEEFLKATRGIQEAASGKTTRSGTPEVVKMEKLDVA